MQENPAIENEAPVAPGREGLRAVVLQILCGIAVFLALDWTVFGGDRYWRWVAPESGSGSLYYTLRLTESSPAFNHGVLVFGDSRVAEGFSAKLANEEAKRLGSSRTFANSAFPAASPRAWYYELRRYRDLGAKPDAVIFMAVSGRNKYAQVASSDTFDTNLLHPLLGLHDLIQYPASFDRWDLKAKALEGIVFKGFLFQADIADFLADPPRRVATVRDWRAHAVEFVGNYEGRSETLERMPPNSGGAPTAEDLSIWRAKYRGYVNMLTWDQKGPTVDSRLETYDRLWFEASARLCREMGARLIVFRIPRGPLHQFAPPENVWRGALADLAASGDLTLLPANAFNDLEQRKYFFDDLHLNRFGAAEFSPRLAREALRQLAN